VDTYTELWTLTDYNITAPPKMCSRFLSFSRQLKNLWWRFISTYKKEGVGETLFCTRNYICWNWVSAINFKCN